MAIYYVALIILNKLKQELVFKHQGKLLKGILFLQDNIAPHKRIWKLPVTYAFTQ
jgi:hypothetical protein